MSDFDVLEEHARDLGRAIDEFLPDGVGFVLVVFDGKPGGTCTTFVSNADRATVAGVLRELTPIIEHNAAAPPGAVGHPARKEGPAS